MELLNGGVMDCAVFTAFNASTVPPKFLLKEWLRQKESFGQSPLGTLFHTPISAPKTLVK